MVFSQNVFMKVVQNVFMKVVQKTGLNIKVPPQVCSCP